MWKNPMVYSIEEIIPASATSINPIASSGSVSIVHGRPVYVKSRAKIPSNMPIENKIISRIFLEDMSFNILFFGMTLQI